MTKTQIETAVKKDIDELKGTSPSEASSTVDKCVEIASKVIIGRICLELAREGYEFKKNINWKPL